MARTFSSTDNIDCGSGATLDNFLSGTWMAWVRYATADLTSVIASKSSGTAIRLFRRTNDASGRLAFQVGRATTSLLVDADEANLVGAGINKDVFYAAVFDTAGVDGDQKLYTGDLATPAAEPSAYATRTVGSGAVGDDSAANFRLGNNSTGTQPWTSAISVVCVVRRVLTLAEIWSWQFYPHWVANTEGLWIPGWDDGTSVPDHSGNGNTGTITGTTLSRDVALDLDESMFGGDDESESEPWDLPAAAAGVGSLFPDRRRRATAAWLHLMRG